MDNPYFNRNSEGRLFFNFLKMEILASEIFEGAQDRKEIQKILNKWGETLCLAAQDALKDVGDEDPYDIEIEL